MVLSSYSTKIGFGLNPCRQKVILWILFHIQGQWTSNTTEFGLLKVIPKTKNEYYIRDTEGNKLLYSWPS